MFVWAGKSRRGALEAMDSGINLCLSIEAAQISTTFRVCVLKVEARAANERLCACVSGCVVCVCACVCMCVEERD